MPAELYLDTARFGLATEGARRAQLDYVRLTAAEGGSGEVEDLVRRGFDAWPRSLQCRYGGLAGWHGVARLKESLRALLDAPPAAEVLVANRSAQLMKLAARALFLRCRKVLHTDLEWPGYLAALEGERRRVRGELFTLPIRSAVFREKVTARELSAMIVSEYRRQGCDGLFLSSVTFEGVRLPVPAILACLTRGTAPRLVVVDGSQAISHVPDALGQVDLYLAGCHKWLRAGHPMGLALAARRSSSGFIRATRDEMVRTGDLDDPLLSFSDAVEREEFESFTETVDVTALFPSAAALSDPGADRQHLLKTLEVRLRSGEALVEVARSAGWSPLFADRPLRSGILLLKAKNLALEHAPPDKVRAAFQRERITLTAYGGGVLRVCVPEKDWVGGELHRLRAALGRLG